jgi:hypothetical protein
MIGGKPLILTKEQRSRHLYVTGSTGSGKSKFLEYLIRQDIMNWRKSSECGLLLLDRPAPRRLGGGVQPPSTARGGGRGMDTNRKSWPKSLGNRA